MPKLPEPEPARIAGHAKYFSEAETQATFPTETPDGLEIIRWELFSLGLEETHCYCPVIRAGDSEITASNRLWCCFCPKWVRFGNSVSHYKAHVKSHRKRTEEVRQLTETCGTSFMIVSFILQRGEPLTTLKFLRQLPHAEWLPRLEHLSRILFILKDQVKIAIRTDCTRFPIINLAVDGWSDPRGRRFQGIIARRVDPTSSTASTCLLALKEVKSVHESAGELRLVVERVQAKYGIAGKTLNVCTDRCSMNVSAFRIRLGDLGSLFDQPFWLPCTCHIINSILSVFMRAISDRLKPIFRLQHRFQKCGPFLAFLRQHDAPVTSIPSISRVRWYSANGLFQSLSTLWLCMELFAELQGWELPELTSVVKRDIDRLLELTSAFVVAQEDLESDVPASGSRFVPHLLSIRRRMDAFLDDEPGAIQAVDRYIARLEEDYDTEWNVFALMTYLNPSLQWRVGRTCSAERSVQVRELLVALVDRELELHPVTVVDDPPSEDYFTPWGTATQSGFAAVDQIDQYHYIRSRGGSELNFWSHCPAELHALSVVAVKVLSFLTTSASVERAFSTAGLVCTDHQMAMNQRTISARVMIQVNWSAAHPLLRGVLGLGRRGWARLTREREERKFARDEPWWLGIPGFEDADVPLMEDE